MTMFSSLFTGKCAFGDSTLNNNELLISVLNHNEHSQTTNTDTSTLKPLPLVQFCQLLIILIERHKYVVESVTSN